MTALEPRLRGRGSWRAVARTLGSILGVPTLLIPAIGLALAPSAAVGATPDPAKVCGAFYGRGTLSARALPGSVGAAQLAAYGVLRRPASAVDVLPSLPPSGESLGQNVAYALSSYDPGAVRLVGQVAGSSLYLVPGFARSFHLSAACRRALPKAALPYLAYQRDQVGRGAAFCLVEVTPPPGQGFAGENCSGFARVAGGFDLNSADQGNGRGSLFGLVPDGVGAVSLSFAGAVTPTIGMVAENVFTAPAPAGFMRSISSSGLRSPLRLRRELERRLPRSITWLTAPGGAVVRFFPRPAGLIAQYLRLFLSFAGATGGSGTSTTCSSTLGPHGRHTTRCTTHRTGVPPRRRSHTPEREP